MTSFIWLKMYRVGLILAYSKFTSINIILISIIIIEFRWFGKKKCPLLINYIIATNIKFMTKVRRYYIINNVHIKNLCWY